MNDARLGSMSFQSAFGLNFTGVFD